MLLFLEQSHLRTHPFPLERARHNSKDWPTEVQCKCFSANKSIYNRLQMLSIKLILFLNLNILFHRWIVYKTMHQNFECSFYSTLTFKISKSFFFFDGSSTQRTICRTLAQGWFFCPMVMLTGSRVRRAASCSVPVGMVADVNNVWCSSGTCSKISRTCCWNPIFSMVSAFGYLWEWY